VSAAPAAPRPRAARARERARRTARAGGRRARRRPLGDAPSLRFLDFLGRRAPGLAVLVAVGARAGKPGGTLGIRSRAELAAALGA